MKQAVKATVLILFVSLLSGCSSGGAQANNCEAAENTRSSYDLKAGELQAESVKVGEQIIKGWLLEKDAKDTYKLALQVIVTYKECFTPEQVVEAQQYLINNK